ncbi:uncharacterized [Tachysurus ichikawai]
MRLYNDGPRVLGSSNSGWQIQVSFPCQVLQATMLSILFSYLENVEYQQWLSLRHCWLLYEAILAECDGSACREGSLPNENLPASLFPLGSELHNWRVSRASQALLTRSPSPPEDAERGMKRDE